MEIQTDCFAYRHGLCCVLEELVCKEHKCSFYKTREQYRQDAEKYRQKQMARKRPYAY